MKKGFTLVEVLAVIVILGLLVVIIVPVVNNLLGDSEDALYDKQIDSIVKATQKYMVEHSEFMPDEGGSTSFYLYELVNNGVIENNKIINPKTKEELDGCVVVSYNNEFNQFEYNYSDDKSKCVISTFDYVGHEQTYIAKMDGYYRLETWGAQGGDANSTYIGGKGGYASEILHLDSGSLIYIYVGGKGDTCPSPNSFCNGGYNGGGYGRSYSESTSVSAGGGGATHISTSNNLLCYLKDNTSSILLVAAGGGGGHYTNSSNGGIGGNGGGTTGLAPTELLIHNINSDYRLAVPATQNSGACTGNNYNCGSFGLGGNSDFNHAHGAAGSGGGAGYYGGSGANIGPGAGGSSYTLSSGSDIRNISGSDSMPTHDGTGTMIGNSGNGFAKITYLGNTLN